MNVRIDDISGDGSSLSSLSDEERRKLLKPNPSKEDVHKILVSSYADSEKSVNVCHKLESYDDCNYLVEVKGCRYVCKIHNGVESDAYILSPDDCRIELMKQIFNHLKKPEYSVTTSYPIPPNDSSNSSCVHRLAVVSNEHSPRDLVVTLLRYVPGVPMCRVTSMSIETIVDAGQYLGRICHALDDLSTTDAKVVSMAKPLFHAWDGQHTSQVLPKFIQYISCPQRQQMVTSVIQTFTQSMAKQTFRKGILQGDYNDANILLQTSADTETQISGVIDFGDSTYSWRVLDVSVAMTYAMMTTYGKANRSLSAAAAMLRGIHSIYPLLPEELVHLRLLVAVRLACSATLGAYSIHMNPDNHEYLSMHAEPAWRALSLLWSLQHAEAIDNLFHQACHPSFPSSTSKDTGTIYCADISIPDPNIADPLSDIRVRKDDSPEPPVKKIKYPIPLVFVTGNKKKLEEVQRILKLNANFVLTNKKMDLPELQGPPLTIAREKCALAAKEIGGPVITEDTSLCFEALNGLPGPYIKWFLDDVGLDGLVNMITFSKDKRAYAQTVVAYTSGPDEEIHLFDGRTHGVIVSSRGSLDFGWDPIFQPNDNNENLTYAEMNKERKDAISHRSRAFSQLRTFLLQQSSHS